MIVYNRNGNGDDATINAYGYDCATMENVAVISMGGREREREREREMEGEERRGREKDKRMR
jgi:hypothetical protein